MVGKFKKALYAGATALTALLGTGQAWALDVTPTSTFSSAEVPIPGCTSVVGLSGGVWHTQTNGTAPNISFFVRAGTGSSGGSGGAIVSFDSSGNLAFFGAESYNGTPPFGDNIANYCSNLTVVSVEEVTAYSSDPVAFAAAAFVGIKFTVLDSTDGLQYQYTVGFEGVTGTQAVFRRVALDNTSPTATLSSTTTTLSGVTPFTVTATFDEDVTGFNDIANDVTITNGTVTGITAVSASVYTLNVTPTGSGDVSISIPAAAAQDLASNNNTASTALVIGGTIVADTQKAIATFMLGRANNLVANQPGLTRFMQNDGCSSFAASATNGSGAASGCVSQGNAWAEITGSWSGDDSYTLGSFGAHSLMNPNLLVGAMLQVDYAEDAVNNTSGSGWMVGPYFVARIPEQPFFLEGRLLYGQTDNDISPLGTFTDSFDTERFLAQLRATGEYNVQAFTLMPLLDVTYTDDTQKTYVDSLGNTIPGQTVSLTQVTAGMNFATDLDVASGSLQLVGGLSGIYSSSAGAAASPKFENWRGRTHLGLNYGMANGGKLRASTFYDGIGTNYESYGASLGFDMEF